MEPFGFAAQAARGVASLADWEKYGWPERFENAEFAVEVEIDLTDT